MDTVKNLNVSRRTFLTVLSAGSMTVLGLSGCSAWTERRPNEDLVRLAAEYQKILDSNKPNRFQKPFLDAQVDELTSEWNRVCGTDSEGNPPARCTDTAPIEDVNVPAEFTAADLQHDLIEVASGVEKDDQAAIDSGLLVGLAAALGGITKAPQHTELLELAPASVTAEIQDVYNGVHGAIFGSGLAIAEDDGTHAQLLRDTATALRGLRNAIAEAAKQQGVQLDTPPAGFTFEQAPTDVLEFMHEQTHSVVSALRYAAAHAEAGEDIRFAATWCCCIALNEIDLERAQQRNPLKTTVRG